jgi:hypothetical protein
MTEARRLARRGPFTRRSYVVMAGSAFVALYAGLTGAHGPWLWVAVGLVGVESLVFAANGWKCPLTALAVCYGATQGSLFDTFLPERCTRYTFRVFGPLIVFGFALLVWRWA